MGASNHGLHSSKVVHIFMTLRLNFQLSTVFWQAKRKVCSNLHSSSIHELLLAVAVLVYHHFRIINTKYISLNNQTGVEFNARSCKHCNGHDQT